MMLRRVVLRDSASCWESNESQTMDHGRELSQFGFADYIFERERLKVHTKPCKHCPSAHYAPSPEGIDMCAYYLKNEITEENFVFNCAWRPEKICKGIYDRLQFMKQVKETLLLDRKET